MPAIDLPIGFYRIRNPCLMPSREFYRLAFVDAPSKAFSFPLPERPKKVQFNPDHAVLARMKKR